MRLLKDVAQLGTHNRLKFSLCSVHCDLGFGHILLRDELPREACPAGCSVIQCSPAVTTSRAPSADGLLCAVCLPHSPQSPQAGQVCGTIIRMLQAGRKQASGMSTGPSEVDRLLSTDLTSTACLPSLAPPMRQGKSRPQPGNVRLASPGVVCKLNVSTTCSMQVQDAASLALSTSSLACCGASQVHIFASSTLLRMAIIDLVSSLTPLLTFSATRSFSNGLPGLLKKQGVQAKAWPWGIRSFCLVAAAQYHTPKLSQMRKLLYEWH